MVVVVFRQRVRPGFDEELEALGARMYELACNMPGFRSYKDFAAEDGELVSIVEFDTPEHLEAWRNHEEHRAAQRRGREKYFSEYHVQVCSVMRQSRYPG